MTLSDQITVTEIKDEDYVEDAAGSGHRETLNTEGESEGALTHCRFSSSF